MPVAQTQRQKIPGMFSIGKDQDTALGAQAPQSTLMGAASIGGTVTPRRRPGAIAGTLLTGTGSGGTRPPSGGGSVGGGGGPGGQLAVF